MGPDILIVDDEQDVREVVTGILEDEGYAPRVAHDAASALNMVKLRAPALVVLDVWLKGSELDGLDVLKIIKEIDRNLPVIVMSGHGTIETAIQAIRQGAYDFIEKPFSADRLLVVVERALEAARLRRENAHLIASSGGRHQQVIGRSAIIHALVTAASRIAPGNSRVLFTGPPGSGKETFARFLHTQSKRPGAFVAINAASLDPDRVEQALFGEEADDGRILRIGALEEAHNGTLLLDEVAEMPYDTQAKLLRVLVDQRFRRVNGATDVQVNVRVVSSTCKDLREEIGKHRFREDLFHRLNVVPLRVPALSERREDIPLLIEHFLQKIAEAQGAPARRMSSEAIGALQASEWPGNIRQLRNMIERILILSGGDPGQPIGIGDIPSDLGWSGQSRSASATEVIGLPLRDAREQFEREYLMLQITRFGGNISRTAQFIGMERSALHRKLKVLGVDHDKSSENW